MIELLKKKTPYLFKILKSIYYIIYHFEMKVGGELRKRGFKDKRYYKLRNYRNRYKGNRCFIVATGPSLNYEDLEKIRKEYTFGVNSVAMVCNDEKISWQPTFYVVQDWCVFGKLKEYIEKLTESEKFVGDIVYRHYKPDKSYVRYPLDLLDHMTRKNVNNIYFSNDCYEKMGDGFTVTYSALQLAVYMGFNEIYLLGADCDYQGDKKHFFSYDDNGNVNANPMISAYAVAKRALEKSDVNIYNATRGGKLEIFKRVDLDSILGERW